MCIRDRMILEAETYKAEDEAHKATVEARNQLESLVYQTKTSLDNETIRSKLEDHEVSLATELLRETETGCRMIIVKRNIRTNLQKSTAS